MTPLTVAVEELQLVVCAVVGLFSRLLLGKQRTDTQTGAGHAVKHIWGTDKYGRASVSLP